MLKRNLSLIIITGIFIFCGQLAYGANDPNGILPDASGTATPECFAPKHADGSDPTAQENATYCGNYEINDFISLGIKISKWILGIVGSLSLVMFIYGGFMTLISFGSADKIKKSNQITMAAIVGLIIVFSSYLIIKFVLGSMGLDWNGEAVDAKGNPIKLKPKAALMVINRLT